MGSDSYRKQHKYHCRIILLSSTFSNYTVWQDLSQSIADVKVKYPNSKIFLGGDFNCPGINWQSGTLTDSYLPCCFREKLISLSQDAQLEQIVCFPTRSLNILDLYFTSHLGIVSECYSAPGLSDHDAVIVKFVTLLSIKTAFM